MKFIKISLAIFIMFLFTSNTFSQADIRPAVKLKVEKVIVRYHELIYDKPGKTNRKQDELYSLNQMVRDSVPLWAKKYNVNNADGFEKFAAYTGKRMGMQAGKKITVTFTDISGKQESYYIYAMGNDKFRIEDAMITKR